MKPTITETRFGSITLEMGGKSVAYHHDVVIRPSGKVQKRKKKLSKQVYGTSHTISLAEANHIYQEGAEMLLIGTGAFGMVKLSDEAAGFFEEKGVEVESQPTAEAAQVWNELQGAVIGLFHVTC